MPNREALLAVLNKIQSIPRFGGVKPQDGSEPTSGDTWGQEYFRRDHPCGTAMCFAGWAIEMSPDWEWFWHPQLETWMARRADTSPYLTNYEWPDRAAMQILGISGDQSRELFRANATMKTIERIVQEILE